MGSWYIETLQKTLANMVLWYVTKNTPLDSIYTKYYFITYHQAQLFWAKAQNKEKGPK